MLKKLTLVMLGVVLIVINIGAAASAETSTPVITDIEVEGNEKIEDATILEQVQTKVGDELSREKLREDMRSIVDLGYFQDIEVNFQPYQQGLRLIFKVKENPVISEIQIEGNEVVSTQKLKELLGIKTGEMINGNDLKKGVEEINKYYSEQGYVLAQVVDRQIKNQTKLYLRVREGEINKIVIEGNEKTKEYVIRRELSVKSGEVLDIKEVRKDLETVYNLGYFKEVTPKVKGAEDDPEKVDLIINVKEKTGMRKFNFGITHTPATGFAGLVELKNKNMFGEGKELDLMVEYGGQRSRYEVGYFQPWSFGIPLSLDFNLYDTTDKTPDEEKVKKTGGNIELGYPLKNNFKGYFKLNVDEIKEDGELEHDRSLALQTVRDTRDDRFNPQQGDRESLSVTKAGFFGGDRKYTKYKVDLRKYLPSLSNNAWAFRLKWGTAHGDIPKREKYYLAGLDGVRGYDSGVYCKEKDDDDYDPKEAGFVGDSILVGNLEYRIKIIDKLTAVTFIDMGKTFKKEVKLDELSDFHYSTGLGVRIKTPVGQLGLDYGYAPEGFKGGKTNLSITMGQKF